MIGWFLNIIGYNSEPEPEPEPKWDKPEEWSETLSESVSAVFKELNEMPQEEFDALIDEQLEKMEENKCDPETCGGECQGMGWCDTATEFREKIVPRIVKGEK